MKFLSVALRTLCASDKICNFESKNVLQYSPVTASILLIPEATEDSLIILKKPISPVFLTCVPPHSSIDDSIFLSFEIM